MFIFINILYGKVRLDVCYPNKKEQQNESGRNLGQRQIMVQDNPLAFYPDIKSPCDNFKPIRWQYKYISYHKKINLSNMICKNLDIYVPAKKLTTNTFYRGSGECTSESRTPDLKQFKKPCSRLKLSLTHPSVYPRSG